MKKLLLGLLLVATNAVAGSPFIFKGSVAKNLAGSGIEISNSSSKQILDLSVDPRAGAGVAAAIGTIGMGAGNLYYKTGALDTQWVELPNGPSWLLSGNSGTTPGTDFIGTTDNKDLVIKTNGSDQIVFNASGGMYSIQNLVPANSTSKYIASLQSNYNPTSTTTGDYNIVLPVTGNYDQGNAGFSAGTVEAISPRITHGGSGTIDYASVVDATAYFGPNAGTTTLFKGINSDTQIASGYTVTQFAGIQSNLNTTGGIVNGSLAEIGSNIVDSDITNFTGLNINQGFSGTFSSVQSINGESEFMYFNDSSAPLRVYLRNAGLILQDTASATNGVTGDNVNLQFNNSSNPGSINGAIYSFGLNNSSTASYISGFSVNGHIGDTATATNVNLGNLYNNLDGSGHIQSLTGLYVHPEIQGSSIIDNGYNGAFFGGQIRGSSSVGYASGLSASPKVSGSGSVTGDVIGAVINPQAQNTATIGGSLIGARINANQLNTATVSGGLTGIQVGVSSATAVSQATGISVDMSGVNVGDGNLRDGLTINEGSASVDAKYTVQPDDSFIMLNYLGGSETVASGSPVSAYGFGNNLAHTIDFQDDWTADIAGIGYNDVGFVGSITGTAGKTMHMWTGALGGASNPSGSGTLTNATMFKAAGIMPQGGSLAVTNMYGFQVDPNLFGVIGTNVWGFHNGGSSENFMKKLAINTSTEKVAVGVALDVSGKIKTDDSLILEDPGAGTNKWTIQSPTLAADYSLTLPVNDGSSGECLKTDGSGVTSWGPCSGGSLSLTDAHIYVGNASNVATDVAVSGDLTLANTGAFTIANSAVTNAKMANMAANTIKGNNTGSPAAPIDLTATQTTAMLDNFVGDSGSGGTKGLVPAPASGDAAAGKYLKADGTWATVPGGLTSPLTTKGDVWVWSTTNDRLPVGTDGQVLSADSTQTTGLKWIAVPSASPTIFGSRGTPRSIVAATGITSGASHMSTTAVNQKIYVQGSGGAVTVTANPAISAHTIDGAEMKICGRDDTNTVTLTNGNGLSLNGSVTLGADDCITLSWDTTNYVELSRSN